MDYNQEYCDCPDFGHYVIGETEICNRCNRKKQQVMKATNLFPKWAADELEYQKNKIALLKKADNEQYKGSYYFGIRQMIELRQRIISLIEGNEDYAIENYKLKKELELSEIEVQKLIYQLNEKI